MKEERPQYSKCRERCQLIRLDSHIPAKAASPEYIFSFAYKKPRIPKTWEWMGTKNGTGLLDLPRELRDIIYGYVCDDMIHNGYGWRKEDEWAEDCDTDDSDTDGSDTDGSDTDGSDTDGSDTDDNDTDDNDTGDDDTDDQEPIVYQNCNIMRICRQVHWEFAEVLYARPLQLTSIPPFSKLHLVTTGSHILPLSRTYGHFVKKLAFIHSIDREDYLGLEPETGWHFHANAEVLWLDVVTATRKLLKLFPTLQILRILVTNERTTTPAKHDVLMALLGKRTNRREELVEIAEDLIQAVRWSDTKPIEVPQQLKLLYLEDANGIVSEMPLGEALRNIQAAELHKKELREKS
ncbi:hypothetical protein AG0111_0g8827 [Alternaria gaisen]|uniref:Uncharacterized protein n=1 Tax=Alternaria gaisen TaxID=167740 RepID=A0ACB6FDN8_9PLEO|nr:hypothetical protein AG0111_0g8827 [Alternaria gaisen]